MAEINATTSQLARALLDLKGKPLSFDNYKPFELIYDVDPPILVGKAGRQIGKSVGIAGITTIKSISRGYFNSLYIAPLAAQTKRFSTMYLDMFIESPLISKYFKDRTSTKNVFEKSFSNGSISFLSYAETETDADRIRGIMADSLTIDEVQDVSYDALPPIFEILSASDYGYKRLFGTSKSTSNTLEYMWQRSNQLEWVIRCDSCRKHIVPYDYDTCLAICGNPKGPQCVYCGSVIDVNNGQWIPMMPQEQRIYGFHLPQFIMKANTTPKKWIDLFDKIHNGVYSPDKIANEVFGIATDLAGKSISMKDVMGCCNQSEQMWHNTVPRDRGIMQVIIGVDWSVTGSDKSYTVISAVGYDSMGKMHLLRSERVQGTDILSQVDKVLEMYYAFGATLIASDRGVGVVQVQLMQQKLGFDKVLSCQYVTSNAKLRWNNDGGFLAAERTQAIDSVIMRIRRGRDRFETPAFDLTQSMWQDALNIYEEETKAGKRVYRHHPDEPDDWLHSLVFANIGHQYLSGDYQITG